MATAEVKKCINHSEVDSITRCDVCLKPLCGDCIVAHEQQPYCSEECLKNHLGFNSKITDSLEQDRKKAAVRNIRNTLIFIIVCILIWNVYKYMQDKKKKKTPPADTPSSLIINHAVPRLL